MYGTHIRLLLSEHHNVMEQRGIHMYSGQSFGMAFMRCHSIVAKVAHANFVGN